MLKLHNRDLTQNNPGLQELLASTKAYTNQLQNIVADGTYHAAESSIILPSDRAILQAAQTLARQKANASLRYHIVVGIGGSNLGTKAIYDALRGYADVFEPEQLPKLIFAETSDPAWLTAATKLLQTIQKPEHILISVISKSGGTTETLANFEIIMQPLRDKFDNYLERVVAITDEGSALWQQAEALGVARLAIPKPVGGRYSVLSSVGLFPLATIGIDVATLCTGATQLRDTCLQDPQNPAAASAALLAYHKAQGKTINDNFFFSPLLESLGKWYRQLMGESIGKAQSLDGHTVHTGITPTVSLGSTDLHSVGQLYLGGPKDKFTTFVYATHAPEIKVPDSRIMPQLVPMISNRSANYIMHAILQGVKTAYQKADLPYMEIALDAIDEQSLGAYLQFKMLEMMYLGQLLKVNSFDQPSVESYKTETKRILETNNTA